jgi:ABC-2 type transport system permease protein
MRRMMAVYRKELQMFFYSPTSYVAFAVYVLMSSIFFYLAFVLTQPSTIDIRGIVGNTTFIYLFIVPLLTMRLVADEFRHGTDELLLTSPASLTEIILGKYAAAVTVQLMLVATSLIYPLIESQYGTLDKPVLWLSYFSMFLLGSAMMAVGLFASSLSANQMVSGIVAFVLLLVLWLFDWLGDFAGGKFKDVITQFSLNSRVANLQKGVLNGADVLFYVTLAALFLLLSIQVLERKRWR